MKKSIFKLSMAMVVVVVLTVALFTVVSAEIISGPCGSDGDNVTYTLDTESGELKISGTGDMENFSPAVHPWNNNRDYIKSVEISEGVTSIGEYSFFRCYNLNDVLIGPDVVNIYRDAFSQCGVSEIVVPDSVTFIDHFAFHYMGDLTYVKIGKGLRRMGNFVFSGSNSLVEIDVDEENAVYCDVDGVLFSKDKKTILAFPGGKATSYVIPDGVTTIGARSFCDCKFLVNVTIPDSVTDILSFAFADCDMLEEVDIPDSVIRIQSCVFRSCYALERMEIPGSVTYLSGDVFEKCTGLREVLVDDANEAYCDVDGIVFSKDKKTLVLYPAGGATIYMIPDYVTDIGSGAFLGCVNLANIEISDSVVNIGDSAFSGCLGLTSIKIPDSVINIGQNTFHNCLELTSIELPNSVANVGNYAFRGCRNIESVTFKTKDAFIGGAAFENCEKLTTIYCYKNSTADEYFSDDEYTKIYFEDFLTFTVESAQVKAGSTVSVDVVISNNVGFAGASLEIEYDRTAMSLVSCTFGLWEGTTNFDQNPAHNPVGFSWIRTKDMTSNGALVTLTFSVNKDAAPGEYDLKLTSKFGVSNQDHESVKYDLVDGVITVVDSVPGDLNRDGYVNAKDSVLLAQYLASWDITLDIFAADCNGDGTVNAKDAVLLAQYLAGWDVTLG